jgi:hypothetical protein
VLIPNISRTQKFGENLTSDQTHHAKRVAGGIQKEVSPLIRERLPSAVESGTGKVEEATTDKERIEADAEVFCRLRQRQQTRWSHQPEHYVALRRE